MRTINIRAVLTISLFVAFLTIASFWVAGQAPSWLPPQASAESKLYDELFSILSGIGTFILLGITLVLLYAVLFQRAAKYDDGDGPSIEGNTAIEIIWTLVPLGLVIWIATYSYQIYDTMAIRGPVELVHLHNPIEMKSALAVPLDEVKPQLPTEEIDVTAKQWAWVFRYPENVTSTELHLPVDHRIRLALHSDDVLHGFYVPAFRLKQDVIPNKTIDFEFTPIRIGKYRLRDSLYSGTYFAANQADVVVESAEDYDRWLANAAKQTPTPAFNPASAEYNRASEKTLVRGWKSVPPAPPPVVNFAPKQEPSSPPA
ncbi:cytochrome c oxidase subunit II [Leptolyngbya sp. NIES-2104]|uniref:cytochrome c oxidase subunit II n=1 Tax=Leptolyngbya sp. NIES-2104 TaxID=1552121 RepID=UPI0006EC94E1|nr:cytochrome c oxidase subunit II [Leptolyngbya sp. NIES-2104]GAP98622.1 cytochrome c oxidase polypeptide II [Leptolyngbya sp. NIES-2104]